MQIRPILYVFNRESKVEREYLVNLDETLSKVELGQKEILVRKGNLECLDHLDILDLQDEKVSLA